MSREHRPFTTKKYTLIATSEVQQTQPQINDKVLKVTNAGGGGRGCCLRRQNHILK